MWPPPSCQECCSHLMQTAISCVVEKSQYCLRELRITILVPGCIGGSWPPNLRAVLYHLMSHANTQTGRICALISLCGLHVIYQNDSNKHARYAGSTGWVGYGVVEILILLALLRLRRPPTTTIFHHHHLRGFYFVDLVSQLGKRANSFWKWVTPPHGRSWKEETSRRKHTWCQPPRDQQGTHFGVSHPSRSVNPPPDNAERREQPKPLNVGWREVLYTTKFLPSPHVRRR